MRAVMVVLILAGAACTTSKGKANPPLLPAATTTTMSGVTTTTVDATKAAILAAYRAEWADVIAVDTVYPVRPLDPRLKAHATGKQLLAIQQALTKLRLLNHYERGTTDLSPVITAIDGDSATIHDCILDHSVEIDFESNSPVEKPNVGHTLDMYTMTRLSGLWYVSDSIVLGSGKSGDACTT
jgi:hypothetical protein